MQKKTGKLSKEAVEFIQDNSTSMKPEDIAEKIGKSVDTVNRYIEKNNLIKFGNTFEEKVINKLKAVLYTEPFWPAIMENYSEQEQKIFEEWWIRLVRQFDEDVTATEKLQIHKYLTLMLQRERAIHKQTLFQRTLESVSETLDRERFRPPDERSDALVDKLAQTVQSLTQESKLISREIKDLSEQESKIESSLKGTRDQRIKQISDAAKNWSGTLHMLESPKLRRELGMHVEIHRQAMEKSKQLISQPRQFFDKSVSIPLLSSETCDNLIFYDEDENEEVE